MAHYTDRLRRLAMSDRRSIDEVLGCRDGPVEAGLASVDLDARTVALVHVAALVAVDGPNAAFDDAVAVAIAAGATPDDLVDTMIAVGPTIGSARLVSAAPKLAIALGYDVGAGLEALDAEPDAR